MAGNFLDRVVGWFNPVAGYQRAVMREHMYALGSASTYRSASRTRLNADWIPTLGSADSDSLYALDELRAKSRDLDRNNDYAGGLIDAIVDNSVGTGLVMHAALDVESLGIEETQAQEFEQAAEAAWYNWAPTASAMSSANGPRDSIDDIVRLALRTVLVDGEFLGRIVTFNDVGRAARGSRYSVAIEPIDVDRLVSPGRGKMETRGGRTIRHGIEVNAFGRPVAYWILKQHPRERGLIATFNEGDFVRVPAEDIVHIYDRKRVGQTRGVPFLSRSLDTFEDVAKLIQAELVTARVNACQSLFIRQSNAATFAGNVPGQLNSQGNREEYLEPGIIRRLGPGEEPFPFNPNRPGDAFAPFLAALLAKLAAGASVNTELVSRDYTKTTFSGGRQSSRMALKLFQRLGRLIADRLCQRMYERVLMEAIQAGDVALPGSATPQRVRQWAGAVWAGPEWDGYANPLQEINAAKTAIEIGISSPSIEAAKLGRDAAEVARAREKDRRMGLLAAPTEPAAEDPEDDTNDDEDEGRAAA